MISKVEIINLALTNLSKSTITSIDEASEPARRAKIAWDFCRKSVLRDYDWPFARKIISLTELSNDTVINYQYVYALPSDYLQSRKVFNQSTVNVGWTTDTTTYNATNEPQTFIILHSNLGSYKILAANISDAYLHYTSNVIDTAMFDDSFILALSYNLAAVLAPTMTADNQKVNQMMQLYAMALSNAKTNSQSEQYETPSNTSQSTYYNCR